jgi:trehalose synthase-fused probable maltokinase
MSRPTLQDKFLSCLIEQLPHAMGDFLLRQRWFGGKAKKVRSIEIQDVVPVDGGTFAVFLAFVHIEFASGPGETYSVPLIETARDNPPQAGMPTLTVAVEGVQEPVVLLDALASEPFLVSLLDAIANGRCFPGAHGMVRAVATRALPSIWQPSEPLQPSLMKAEQSNSSVIYGGKLVLKLFRRLEEGTSPDLEIGRFLTERVFFPNTPVVAGYLEYADREERTHSMGILQAFVPNRGDAWQFTLDALADYYVRAGQAGSAPDVPGISLLSLAAGAFPAEAEREIGTYLDSARLLGQRTAELHLALNSIEGDPDFSPEAIRASDQQAFCNSAQELLVSTFNVLRQKMHALPPRIQSSARAVLDAEDRIKSYFSSIPEFKLSGTRSRIHGDYHLGQVLFTGDDFVIIDFEGEPARALKERRAKRSPLQDVAGMLRSFHYAAYAPLLSQPQSDEKLQSLGPWARYWQRWVSAAFLKSYLETSGDAPHIPATQSETEVLLDVYMLDKAIYELAYELNNRPLWVAIPLEGISDLPGWSQGA